jgi:tetratricopeptide (TPR) repeat protein
MIILRGFIMDVQTATDMLKKARFEVDKKERSAKFFKASNYLFRAGAIKEAINCIKEIKEPILLIKLVTDEFVFSKLFEKGNRSILMNILNKAEGELSKINNSQTKMQLAIRIAISWSKMGIMEKSKKIMNSVLKELNEFKTNENYDEIKTELIDLMARIGEFHRARKMVKEISNEDKKSLGLLYIVKAFSYNGMLDEAIMVATEISDEIQRSNAFTYIAVSYLKEGKTQNALKILELIKVSYWNNRVKYWIKKYPS